MLSRASLSFAGALFVATLTMMACGDDPTGEPIAPDASPAEDASFDAGPDDAAPPDADVDAAPVAPRARFVILGDFGFDDANELAVASLVKSWEPDFIVTVGDNSYPESNASTIDETIGKYYGDFIHPYRGKYGPGAKEQRFYACLGNHDWQSGSIQAHLDYFDLPGNERYWEIAKGPVRFFCVDSDTHEPDGTTPASVQGAWLQGALGAAKDPYRVVVFHHPSHSSGQHGSQAYMQWPFQEWGASAVYTGHDHDYERFDFGPGTIPYVVQGLGGADLRPMSTSRAGSVVTFNAAHGATLVEADEHYAVFAAITVTKERVDEHVVASSIEAKRGTEIFLPRGSTLRYVDDAAPAAGWTSPSFDASAWKSGVAPMGYGQGGEQTVLASGLAHYFRATFTVANPSLFDHAVVWLQRDDGAVVYVNGEEIARSNMPAGPIGATTLALQTVGYAAERAWVPAIVPRRLLRAGDNVVAVELHQASATSSDCTLDLEIEGKK
ncbi:MAG: metallophosphoesterase [Labilithrix sp.]|nr:metallophosphoesterase [Labilithrix sp.]